MSRTAAKEKRDKRKGDIAVGELAVNGKVWRNKRWEQTDEQPSVEDILFEEACEKYLEWYKGHSRPRSHERHATSSIAPLKAALTGKRLSQISAFAIDKYKLERKAAQKAESTINRDLTMLKHLFSKCITWKFAKSTPMKNVKLYKESNNRVRYLTDKEARRLLTACNKDFRIVALAAMLTGLRRNELRSLRWSNVDFENDSIKVESAYSKNGVFGSVLHPDLKKVLKQLDDEQKPAPEDNVFVNRYNKPWKSWRTAFKNACERAKIKDFHFHDLRHCFGSWLAMHGTDIKARMELMRS